MNFCMKGEWNTIIFPTIAFLVGLSILYVRDNNRKNELIVIDVNQEISDIVKSDQTIIGTLNLNMAIVSELI